MKQTGFANHFVSFFFFTFYTSQLHCNWRCKRKICRCHYSNSLVVAQQFERAIASAVSIPHINAGCSQLFLGKRSTWCGEGHVLFSVYGGRRAVFEPSWPGMLVCSQPPWHPQTWPCGWSCGWWHCCGPEQWAEHTVRFYLGLRCWCQPSPMAYITRYWIITANQLTKKRMYHHRQYTLSGKHLNLLVCAEYLWKGNGLIPIYAFPICLWPAETQWHKS